MTLKTTNNSDNSSQEQTQQSGDSTTKDDKSEKEVKPESTTTTLSLPKKLTLPDLIQNYFEPEHLTGDNKYLCENCDNHTEADRRVTVTTPPECLLITLLRSVIVTMSTMI